MSARGLTRERSSRFDTDGYVLLPGAVEPARVTAAQRLINLEIRRRGLTAEEIASCQHATFFPNLRDTPEVWAALPAAAAAVLRLRESDEWAEPQLLLRFPDEDQPWPPQPHVDEPPPWAGGRPYRGIVGVALTRAGADEGVPCVWPGSHRGHGEDPVLVPMDAGDALVMHPALEHSGTLNLGAHIRETIYFRLLAATPPG